MGDGTALVLALPRLEEALTDRRPGRDELVVALFDEHYPGLCRLATLLLGDASAAEEVVQEAFLRTYAGWWRLRRPTRAQWYLRAAVVNQCRSRGRRRASEDRGNRTVWATEGAPPAQWDTDRTGETQAVLEAVRSLPERQREAVVLRYYEDLAEADVAAALGCSVGTVKSQLSKARATLARRLAEPTEPVRHDELDRSRRPGGGGERRAGA
jgi:RNA polymerase sigma-70 factor (sigma-E family)